MLDRSALRVQEPSFNFHTPSPSQILLSTKRHTHEETSVTLLGIQPSQPPQQKLPLSKQQQRQQDRQTQTRHINEMKDIISVVYPAPIPLPASKFTAIRNRFTSFTQGDTVIVLCPGDMLLPTETVAFYVESTNTAQLVLHTSLWEDICTNLAPSGSPMTLSMKITAFGWADSDGQDMDCVYMEPTVKRANDGVWVELDLIVGLSEKPKISQLAALNPFNNEKPSCLREVVRKK